MRLYQSFQLRIQKLAIFNDARNPVGMDGCVVPGGYAQRDIIPGGRDVGVRPRKDDQRFSLARECMPLRVGPRHMRLNRPIITAPGIVEEREMGSAGRIFSLRHQYAKAMLAYERL